MKLARVTSNESTERLAVTMKSSVAANLKAYREFYKATYGDEIAMNHLIETMLAEFMRDDKEFMKSLQGQPGKLKQSKAD